MFRLRTLACALTFAATATSAFAQASSTQNTTGSTRIIQPIALTKTTDLAFGSVVRPTSGTNTVAIDQATGARSLSGGGNAAAAPSTTSRAAYSVAGEGAQTFSITVPATFNMTRVSGSEILAVTLTSTATSGTLSGTLGSAGAATFGVGGSFPVATTTVSGNYTGTFDVTVAYN